MEKQELQLGERSYVMIVPSVRVAMPLCTRTATLIGPFIGSLSSDAGKGGWEQFARIIEKTDPEKVDKLLFDAVMSAKLHANGNPACTPLDFERHFNEHRADLYQVSVWCLWETVKDFFPQLGDFIQKAKEVALKMASQSLSQMDGK